MLTRLAEPRLVQRPAEPLRTQPQLPLKPKRQPSPPLNGTANLDILPSVSASTLQKTFRSKVEPIAKQPVRRGISKHLHDLQSWIDDPRHHRQLRRDIGRWNQLLSSLQ